MTRVDTPKPGAVVQALRPEGTMCFWFPMPPNQGNARHGHWGQRHRATQDYHSELDLRCPGHHIPRPPALPFRRAHIKATFYVDNRSHFMDPDNRMARLKPVIDWLRTRGYIVNDRGENVHIEPVEQEKKIGVEPELCSLYLELTPSP